MCFDVDASIIYIERVETLPPSETVEDILKNLEHFQTFPHHVATDSRSLALLEFLVYAVRLVVRRDRDTVRESKETDKRLQTGASSTLAPVVKVNYLPSPQPINQGHYQHDRVWRLGVW